MYHRCAKRSLKSPYVSGFVIPGSSRFFTSAKSFAWYRSPCDCIVLTNAKASVSLFMPNAIKANHTTVKSALDFLLQRHLPKTRQDSRQANSLYQPFLCHHVALFTVAYPPPFFLFFFFPFLSLWLFHPAAFAKVCFKG